MKKSRQSPPRSTSYDSDEDPKTPEAVSRPVLDDKKISSVVKIFTTAKEPDYSSPWSSPGIQSFTGTGFIIDGKKIITNGHVVANQVFMQVQIAGSSKKFKARLLHHADHCDLAVVTVDEPAFWAQAHQCALGELPGLRSKVQVYGFPMGGSELSITEGIISRIDFDQYAHSEEECLVVQVDAAINPGNSGGPVFDEHNTVIGIVHQGIDAGQNLGYFIPVSLLKNVLSQIHTFGDFKGLVDFDIKTQRLENKYLRKHAGLEGDEEGLVINSIDENNPLSKFLFKHDVLMTVDGYQISNQGTVKRFGSNLNYKHLFHEKKPGDLITLIIKRNKKNLTLHLPLQSVIGEHRIVDPIRYNEKPSFITYAGLVFTPLSTNYIRDTFGGLFDTTPGHFKSYEKMPISKKLRQVVLLSSKLNNAEIEGYSGIEDRVVKSVQYTEQKGTKTITTTVNIIDLIHLARLLANKNILSYLFILDNEKSVVLDKLSSAKHQEILNLFDMPFDRSEDIREQCPGEFTKASSPVSLLFQSTHTSSVSGPASSSSKSFLDMSFPSDSDDEDFDPSEQEHLLPQKKR